MLVHRTVHSLLGRQLSNRKVEVTWCGSHLLYFPRLRPDASFDVAASLYVTPGTARLSLSKDVNKRRQDASLYRDKSEGIKSAKLND